MSSHRGTGKIGLVNSTIGSKQKGTMSTVGPGSPGGFPLGAMDSTYNQKTCSRLFRDTELYVCLAVNS